MHELVSHPDAAIDTSFAVDVINDMMDEDLDSSPTLEACANPESIWRDCE